MKTRILPYHPDYREKMINVWERSVRATHHFLAPTDIDFYKSLVSQMDFGAFQSYYILDESDDVVGILGITPGKLEMLFVIPECIGKGVGRSAMDFVLDELNVTHVDVNEGNSSAVDFYKHFGFEVYDRTPLDDSGKPYPILKMKLSS